LRAATATMIRKYFFNDIISCSSLSFFC